MNINRNNYEEFFLLYVDNELSAKQKNAVDVFLAENPDLQEEMIMLRQSILIPDESFFADKQSLLKQEAIKDEMQEQLLLMLDNELDKKTTGKLLSLVEKDTAVKQEWGILQQTKLSAEEKIIFEDKAILYKKESGRVIAVRWWSIAAAAMLIGFGVWGALNYAYRSGNIQPGTAKTNAGKSSAPLILKSKIEQPVAEDKNLTVDNVAALDPKKQDEQIKPATPIKTKIVVSAANKQKRLAPQQANDVAKQLAIKTAPSNNLPKPSLDNFNNIPRNNNNGVAVTTLNTSNDENDVMQPKETIPDKSIAILAKYRENDENGNEGLDEGESKSSKSKIGGFFKKLKRVVERKTNMKPGDNNIRIANMSFAVQ